MSNSVGEIEQPGGLGANEHPDRPNAEKGLLDLSVELSTRNITAGKEFTLYVIVKNPYSIPIWIREVNVTLPTDLRLAEESTIKREADQARALYREAEEQRRKEHAQQSEKVNALRDQLISLEGTITSQGIDPEYQKEVVQIIKGVGREVEHLQDSIESKTGLANIHIDGGLIRDIKVGSNISNVHIGGDANISRVEIYEPWVIHAERAEARTIKLKGSLPSNAALRPGNTAVYTALLFVKKSITFAPSIYRIHFCKLFIQF